MCWLDPLPGRGWADEHGAATGAQEDAHAAARLAMVENQLERRGITDAQVLAAMSALPRHLFIPLEMAKDAYSDCPLSIGWGQTISQPYIVAMMTQLARVGPGTRVLEIGTGSGYQTAVLAWLGADVHSLEVVPELAALAAERLGQMGLSNIRLWCRDGYEGLPERAPYDVILCAAAPEKVPETLVEQLGEGGRLIIPVGGQDQTLRRMTRTAAGVRTEDVFAVRFVPLVHPPPPGWRCPL